MSSKSPGEERVLSAPDAPKLEAAAALVKGIVGAIPMAGGVLVELGNLYLNPMENRKRLWELDMTAAVNEITSRLLILPEELAKDERFVSMAYQATLIALKNHQAEKRLALRNVLISAEVAMDVDDDQLFQFLRFVDELGVVHLTMLSVLDKHAGQFAKFTSLEQVFEKFQSVIQVKLERLVLRSYLQELENRFLVHLGDVEELPELQPSHDVLTTEAKRRRRQLSVTPLGRLFLAFVNDACIDDANPRTR